MFRLTSFLGSTLTGAMIGLTLVFAASEASARDVRVFDRVTNRGTPFRLACPQGTFLIRIEGAAGDWIDTVSIVCAEWRASEQRFKWVRTGGLPAGKSTGGRPGAAHCENPRAAINSIRVSGNAYVQDLYGKNQVLRWIRVGCWDHAEQTPQQSSTQFGPLDPYVSNDPGETGWCDSGELATGIYGNETNFITALGLICEPAPKRLPPVIGDVNDRQPGRDYPPPNPRGDSGGYKPGQVELPGSRPVPQQTPQPPELYPDLQNAGPNEPQKVGKRTFSFRYPHIPNPAGQYRLLDWCGTFGAHCGQPAADMFCRAMLGGKYSATDFAEAKRIGTRRATMTIAAQEVCAQAHCSGFQYVTCKRR